MRAVPFVCASLLLFAGSRASAQTDEERLRLMRETVSFTDVIDAFDGADRFDLDVRLAYERQRERGKIYRERTSAAEGRHQVRVADHAREQSRLSLGVDVGLLRDLMATLRIPLVLGDARQLSLPAGYDEGLVRAQLAGAQGAVDPLFSPSFASPTRAGLDYFAVGLAYALLNQMRRPWQPTWVVRVEGRRALGQPLQPCRSGKVCGTESTEDRDSDGELDGTRGVQEPGSSRGMSALELGTRFSRRYRRAEPYAGMGMLVEWPSTARPLFELPGAARARPGMQSSAQLGAALIPWENRGSFQRIVLDVRLDATYVGAGYDYSALFDALGSSGDPELARAYYDTGAGPYGVTCGGDADPACEPAAAREFHGITRVASHLQYGGRIGVEVQAARYVRFMIGSSVNVVTPHAITGASACPSGAAAADGALAEAAGCAEGLRSPRHRPVIDANGRRFFMRDQLLLGVFAQATAMF